MKTITDHIEELEQLTAAPLTDEQLTNTAAQAQRLAQLAKLDQLKTAKAAADRLDAERTKAEAQAEAVGVKVVVA